MDVERRGTARHRAVRAPGTPVGAPEREHILLDTGPGLSLCSARADRASLRAPFRGTGGPGMKPSGRESEPRIKVLGVKARFVLAMTSALAAVMIVTAFLLYGAAARIVKTSMEDSICEAVRFTHMGTPHEPPDT